MTNEKQRGDRKLDFDARDLTPEERAMRETWEAPRDLDRGGVSANDTARPRDREAVEGNEPAVAGFTTTSPTGSMGGRALYGEEPESETDLERAAKEGE